MQSLSDDLLLGVLEYLADPADWARWSATCRRFRYNVRGAPLCLQLVQLQRQQQQDDDDSSSSCDRRLYLPQLIFCELQESKRLARAHQVSSLTDATRKYRLFTFHAASNGRAYLGRNHEHPNPLPRHISSIETHVHGLAFHVDARSSSACFRHSSQQQQHQYWILHPKDDNDNDESGNENGNDIALFVTRQMQVMGNCNTCPPIIYHSDPRLLTVDYHGNWFVHSQRTTTHHGAFHNNPQRSRNTYGLQLWTPTTTATIQNQHNDNDDNDTSPQTTRRRLLRVLPAIPIQPKPFLSHNGGWNIYEPNAWESVLQTDVRNGMTRHAHLGRCTSLYFHVWIQDSLLYIHAQYLIFPLSIPILQQDQVVEQHGGDRHGHNDDDKAHLFLCHFLWTLFAHDSPRWYAIRHYLSMAANELERLRQMTRRLVERGGDPAITPILPPPARVDNVEDAHDDGSMGLTATHAANTWIILPPQHQREYSYQAAYVEDPDRPQLRPWNNALNVVVLSDNDDATLDPNAPNVAKNMNQPPWSIVFYA